MTVSRAKVALDEVAGLLPGRAGADGGGEDEGQAAFAGPKFGCGGSHEGRAESGGSGRLVRGQTARQFVLKPATLAGREAAE